eukprot:TRINITY_DN9080_c0_g4_i2.p1 TRINITY_DN9080_c0_g4~~TRINITY_DN9080_c0_g4_i2.p1  ORF type:complete len:1210 (-),score=279.99 TRINITY_DN9080_c0_g4_i2:887-4516(-)
MAGGGAVAILATNTPAEMYHEEQLVLPKLSSLLSQERAGEPDGLWVARQFGDFEPGDLRKLRAATATRGNTPAQAGDVPLSPHQQPDKELIVTGSVEVRQLRSMLKLAFVNLALQSASKKSEANAAGGASTGTLSLRSGADLAEQLEAALSDTGSVGVEQWAPKLYCYLTKKKPKARMADLEETGFLLLMDGSSDGSICQAPAYGTFDQSLLHVPSASEYCGAVIVKRAQDAPVTEEPVVFGFARLLQQRRPLVAAAAALGMQDDKDRVQRFDAAKTDTAPATKKSDKELMRDVKMYARTSKMAWQALRKSQDEDISFEEFKEGLDQLNIVVLESRALRLFQQCDLQGTGRIGLTEFEMALMMHDAVDKSEHMTPFDSFLVFDLDGSGSISFQEFKQAAMVLGSSRPKRNDASDADQAHDPLDEAALLALYNKMLPSPDGEMAYEHFKQAWLELVDVEAELRLRGLDHAIKKGFRSVKRNKAALIEGVEQADADELQEWSSVRSRIEGVRQQARFKREEKRKKQQLNSGQGLKLADAKAAADRRRERRLMIMKEQKERSKQRDEQKILQNKLAAEEASMKQRNDQATRLGLRQKEKDRVALIRQMGFDQISHAHESHREIPQQIYKEKQAVQRLSDVVLCDFSHNKLTRLPTDGFFYHMAALRALDLRCNRLRSLPEEELGYLPSLQLLYLEGNELTKIPESIGHLLKLERLELGRNSLTDLPQSIGNLALLRVVSLHSNQLEALPSTIEGWSKCEVLNLAYNCLRELPEEISFLTSLTNLDIQHNRLQQLPIEMGNLCSLKCLEAGGNVLSALPESMSALCNLQVLHLAQNCLTQLTAMVAGWTALVELDVRANQIQQVSHKMGQWTALQWLDISSNQLQSLPPDVGCCKKIRHLDASCNKMLAVPDEVGALILLNQLNLGHNKVGPAVSEHVGLLRQLLALELSNNNLGRLPPSIGALQGLTHLDCSHNCITQLPQNLALLSKTLKVLKASHNSLAEVPEFLCTMGALTDLDLSCNRLSLLPKTIINLVQLRRLNLRRNMLKAVPPEMTEMLTQLELCDIENNPLNMLPDKWHCQWTARQAAFPSNGPLGYTPQEVVQWPEVEHKVFSAAEHEWTGKAAFYLSGRASMTEFIQAVTHALNGTSRGRGTVISQPMCEKHLIRFFMTSMATGSVPLTSQISLDEQTPCMPRLARALVSRSMTATPPSAA